MMRIHGGDHHGGFDERIPDEFVYVVVRLRPGRGSQPVGMFPDGVAYGANLDPRKKIV
jgi:hypothetical protein